MAGNAMKTSVIAVLMMLICGLALPRCSDDVDEDLLPVHLSVYNTDDVDFSIKIGDHDFGKVLKNTKTKYVEFEPLGSYTILIDSVAAEKNLLTGSGGIYTLEIPDKDTISTWKVVAD